MKIGPTWYLTNLGGLTRLPNYVNYVYMRDLKENSGVKPYHGLDRDVEF